MPPAQLSHADAPASELLPASQSTHELAPVPAQRPGSHLVQFTALPFDHEPASHLMHVPLFGKGCAVPDEYLRSGRRSLKKDGTDAKLKARSRQRIDTQKAAPLHPDCAEARRNFLARFK